MNAPDNDRIHIDSVPYPVERPATRRLVVKDCGKSLLGRLAVPADDTRCLGLWLNGNRFVSVRMDAETERCTFSAEHTLTGDHVAKLISEHWDRIESIGHEALSVRPPRPRPVADLRQKLKAQPKPAFCF